MWVRPPGQHPSGSSGTIKNGSCAGWFSRIAEYGSKVADLWRRAYQNAKLTLQEAKKKDIHGLGRGLQLLFIGIFASLPALLFYLYDRYARAKLLSLASFIWGATTWLSS
jgi:hypothetical protein